MIQSSGAVSIPTFLPQSLVQWCPVGFLCRQENSSLSQPAKAHSWAEEEPPFCACPCLLHSPHLHSAFWILLNVSLPLSLTGFSTVFLISLYQNQLSQYYVYLIWLVLIIIYCLLFRILYNISKLLVSFCFSFKVIKRKISVCFFLYCIFFVFSCLPVFSKMLSIFLKSTFAVGLWLSG